MSECDPDMNLNVSNSNLIILKIEQSVFCVSNSTIEKELLKQPIMVSSTFNPFVYSEKEEIVSVQKIKKLQHLRLKDKRIIKVNDIFLDETFIEKFLNNFNTFELYNKRQTYFYRDENEFGITDNLFSAKAIPRTNIEPSLSVNERTLKFYENKEKEGNIILENVYTEKNERDENPIKYKCNEGERSNDMFGDDVTTYDNNTIIMYEEGNENTVFCYTIPELKKVMHQYLDKTYNSMFVEIDELPHEVVINIPYWGIFILYKDLLQLINNRVNTIKVKKVGTFGPNNIKYYKPYKGYRNDIFKGYNFEDELSVDPNFNFDNVHDDGEVRHRKRIMYYFDENYNKKSNVYATEWVKENINDVNPKPILDNYKDEPARVEYYESKNSENIENGDNKQNIKLQEWLINGEYGREAKGPHLIQYNDNNANSVLYTKWFSKDYNVNIPSVIEEYSDSKSENVFVTQLWFRNDILHRDSDLPAEIKEYKNGIPIYKKWFLNGKNTSPSGLAEERFYSNGKIKYQLYTYPNGYMKNDMFYDQNSKIGRDDDRPAITLYYLSDPKEPIIRRQEYYKDGLLHREHKENKYNQDYPAVVSYFNNSQIELKAFYTYGKLNRTQTDENGDVLPALIRYYENENKKEEKWFENNVNYNETGPSYIKYRNDQFNSIEQEEYTYPNGRTKKEINFSVDEKDNKYTEVVSFYDMPGDSMSKMAYYKNGQLHKDDDEPALSVYNEEHKEIKTAYYKNGKLNREGDLPAEIIRNKDGKKIEERWFKDGFPFREDNKPVIVLYDRNESPI